MAETMTSPTVYGIETEHTHLITYRQTSAHAKLDTSRVGSCHTSDDVDFTEPMKSPVSDELKDFTEIALAKLGIQKAGSYLSNGGKLYFEESGYETATAETTTALEAALRSLDETWLLYKILGRAQQEDVIHTFQVNRRTADHVGNARGTHLNVPIATNFFRNHECVKRFDSLFEYLNIAKGGLFGSGGLLVSEHTGRTNFYHSPRLAVTDTRRSVDSELVQALVRSAGKADVDCLRTEHVSGDALNFVWPLRASLVMSRAAVLLLEAEHEGDIPRIYDVLGAANTVGRYGPQARIRAHTKDGKTLTLSPLDMLRTIAERALTLEKVGVEIPAEMKQVLGEIITIADITAKDMFGAPAQVESVLRFQMLLKRKNELEEADPSLKSEKGKAWRTEELCKRDYMWDLAGGGIAETLRESGKVGWFGVSKPDTHAARIQRIKRPPTNTRAVVRAEAVKDSSKGTVVDWYTIEKDGYSCELHVLDTELNIP